MRPAPSAADLRFPRPNTFPSESWLAPPLARVAVAEERAKLASELAATPTGSRDDFHRLVLTTTIAEYTGERLHGLPHGHGRAVFKAGQTYEGEFERGLMHGQGCYTWTDGSTYTGTMLHQSATGVGLIVWPDGSSYQGDVVDGYRHGHGVFIDPTVPCLYEGEWEHGLRHGKGKITYDDAGTNYYEGQWVEGARHGYGLLRYKSGNLYEGQWVWDRKVGRGTMNWFTLNQRYVGEWLNDRPDGSGEYTWLDLPVGGVKQLEVVRSNGVPIGAKAHQQQLITHFQHHNRYVGSFVQGVRDGRGTFHYSNGSIYDGDWEGDRKHGAGRFTFANGSTYEGAFTNDTMSDGRKWKHPYSGVAEALDGVSLNATTASLPPMATGRTAKALEAATNASQKDVGMFDLPLDGTLLAHAESLGFGPRHSSSASFVSGQRDALTNLLLRYNTELLDIYRFYAQLEVDISRPEYREPTLPFEPLSPTHALGREHVSANAANVSARMTLAQMWQFVADLGIVGLPAAPDVTLAALDRLIIDSTDTANRTLLPDLSSLHDGRQVLLLREFACALIRIAEVVCETAPEQEEASANGATTALREEDEAALAAEEEKEKDADDDEDAESEFIEPSVLYARAQDRFNFLLTGVEQTPPVLPDLPLALAPQSPSPHTVVASPKSATAKLHSRAHSRTHSGGSRSHSRQPSGQSTPALASPLSVSSTARSGGVNMQTFDDKSSPFSSTGGVSLGTVQGPFAGTGVFSASMTRTSSPPKPTLNTLAVRFKRFLSEFVLPKARMRSKHGFGALFRDHAAATKPTPLYRIPPILALIKRYERELYINIFLPCATIHRSSPTAVVAAGGAASPSPLLDRTIRLVDALDFLKSHSTCFNSFFTLYHALDVLFGVQNHAEEALHQALGRELLWEEFVEVLVRIAMYRGKILASVSASLAAERTAVGLIEAKRRDEAEAAAARAAEEAAAAAAAEQSDENKRSKTPVSKPASAKSTASGSAPASAKGTGSKSSSQKKDAAPSPKMQPSNSKKELAKKGTAAAPAPIAVTAPTTPAPALASSPRSPIHHPHISLGGTGSLKKRVPDLGLSDEFARLSLANEFGPQSPSSPSFEADYSRWTADTEQFFCTLLHRRLPPGVHTSFPINMLMV